MSTRQSRIFESVYVQAFMRGVDESAFDWLEDDLSHGFESVAKVANRVASAAAARVALEPAPEPAPRDWDAELAALDGVTTFKWVRADSDHCNAYALSGPWVLVVPAARAADERTSEWRRQHPEVAALVDAREAERQAQLAKTRKDNGQ